LDALGVVLDDHLTVARADFITFVLLGKMLELRARKRLSDCGARVDIVGTEDGVSVLLNSLRLKRFEMVVRSRG